MSVNTIVDCEVVLDDNSESSALLSEPDDVLVLNVFFFGSLVPQAVVLFGLLLILRSMKSEMRPGFVILPSSTFISPDNILTTVDITGRSFGLSWVHKRPIFKYLQASSASKSPCIAD
ncbi:hypothetical protein Ccrd_011331 [Cynara cardunculus var. scolymus]|uniref:Uncharacterized protein n=1 Tax=Cynara cardunculus var. scolymus TaxID=59895 RepID=A0A103YJJ2_CYNCS|nr:hypothetical protein Ccrd_011331 [Cynara cardunculus var. scolymus]